MCVSNRSSGKWLVGAFDHLYPPDESATRFLIQIHVDAVSLPSHLPVDLLAQSKSTSERCHLRPKINNDNAFPSILSNSHKCIAKSKK